MKNSNAIRLTEEFLKFSTKAQANRIIKEMDEEPIGHPRISKLLVKFFKANNDAYIKFVETKEDKNA